MKRGSHHDLESRARVSEATRRAMADPAVRKRVSDCTKAGIAMRTSKLAPERDALLKAWFAARPAARQAFLETVLKTACLALISDADRSE